MQALSERECDVVALTLSGEAPGRIAEALDVSPGRVSNLLRQAETKSPALSMTMAGAKAFYRTRARKAS